MSNETSIFNTVLNKLSASQKRGDGDLKQQPNNNPFDSRPKTKMSSYEDYQQEYLDWQVNKISQNLYQKTLYYDTDRISAYQDYRAMDMSPEISAALDIMRDECLTRSESGKILEIFSEDESVKKILEDLFYDRLNIEYNMRLWIRDLLKYGDYFVHLHIHKDDGIYDIMSLPQEEIHREEGFDGTVGSVRFRWETTHDYFESWQVAHFRLIEDTRKMPYGRSVIDSARKLWKQLQLAEDAMLVYRLCLVGDTRIKTPNGYKYIKDIKIGDSVYSYDRNGKLVETKVVNQVNNGKKELYRLKSSNIEIIGTETHPVLVNRNGIIQYVDIKDILPKKDKLILVKNIDDGKDIEIKRIFNESYSILSEDGRREFFRLRQNKTTHDRVLIKNEKTLKVKNFLYKKGCSLQTDIAIKVCDEINIDSSNLVECNFNEIKPERINLPKYVDKEFAMLFGFLIGDGYIRNHLVSFASGLDEQQNEFYADLLEKYFGKVSYIKDNRPNRKTGVYKTYNSIASKLFFDMGYISGAKNKRIPEWVFQAKKDIKKAFIKGLSNADGCERFTEKGLWFSTIELCNKQLVEDIKELWTSIGLCSGAIKHRIRKGGHAIDINRTMPSTECWSVTISERPLPEFENAILVEKLDYTEDVFDITVESDLHNFIANGTPVHNTRAPERRIFYIDVGNLEEADVKQFMQRIQQSTKKQPVVNQSNGNVSYKYDPMNVTEDFYIPVRNEKTTKIETLPGAQNLGDIMDIEYLQNKLFAAIKVPKTYLNYAQNLPGGPTLSQADLRFARTINTIQEAVLMELRRIAKIHLAFKRKLNDLNNFDLRLTNPSTQQELLKLETMKSRLEVFKEFVSQDPYAPASYTWGMQNILGFSNHDIKIILRQKKIERKLMTEIESSVQTYKKIGLFDDIDRKYEIPGTAEALQNAENQEFMGGDSSGGGSSGGGAGGGGGEYTGGSPTGSLELGGEGGSAPEGGASGTSAPTPPPPASTEAPGEPISENMRKMNLLDKKIDDTIDLLLKEAEQETKNKFVSSSKKDIGNDLVVKNEELMNQTESMINKISTLSSEDDIVNRIVKRGVIEEYGDIENILLYRHNEIENSVKKLLDEIDVIEEGNVENIEDFEIENE